MMCPSVLYMYRYYVCECGGPDVVWAPPLRTYAPQSELDYLEQLGADIDVHARFGGASHGGHEEDEHTLSMEVRSLACACLHACSRR